MPKCARNLLQMVPASTLPKELGGELPTLQNVYPAPDDSAILDWIARVKGADFWPPRNAATSEEPSELAEPPTPQEAMEPAADVAEAALEIAKPAAAFVEPAAEEEGSTSEGSSATEASPRSCDNIGTDLFGKPRTCEHGSPWADGEPAPTSVKQTLTIAPDVVEASGHASPACCVMQ